MQKSDLDFTNNTISITKTIYNENNKKKLILRNSMDDYRDKDFLFARTNGYPFITKNVAERIKRIIGFTDIKKKATPHFFRHTHISMLTEAKVDIATIMKRVGHEDMNTTMQIYTHVTNKMKKDAPLQVNNLYRDILKNVNL
ncbi:tyrosine-type recombinase/integrase [Alkalihalobacillus trypoxylicola]|uniref:Tyr recombinase domain-containing protein n=1 Tax=Alkalihalobacillus trypoxylicola TaxID=519424 RepID=A0A162EIV8_9BACI|nr:tyrosine-type recombinase/integrase [Alkalihalobacillus trypoxylicola]KYG33015.1 hypothetical protein AZF04_17805 [Alkalihalobacillus trypoxylicola]